MSGVTTTEPIIKPVVEKFVPVQESASVDDHVSPEFDPRFIEDGDASRVTVGVGILQALPSFFNFSQSLNLQACGEPGGAAAPSEFADKLLAHWGKSLMPVSTQ